METCVHVKRQSYFIYWFLIYYHDKKWDTENLFWFPSPNLSQKVMSRSQSMIECNNIVHTISIESFLFFLFSIIDGGWRKIIHFWFKGHRLRSRSQSVIECSGFCGHLIQCNIPVIYLIPVSEEAGREGKTFRLKGHSRAIQKVIVHIESLFHILFILCGWDGKIPINLKVKGEGQSWRNSFTRMIDTMMLGNKDSLL